MEAKLFGLMLGVGSLFIAAGAVDMAHAADVSDVKVPKVEKVNKIYYVTLNAETPYGRGHQHGAALKYVIHKGIAQWKQWINEFLGKQDTDIEIAEFIHDTNFLDGIRKHTPELYEELKGIAKGAEVDFNTLYAFQMFDEFMLYSSEKYRLAHCSGLGVHSRKDLPNVLGQNNDLPPYYDGTHTVLRIKYPGGHEAIVFTWAGCVGQNGVNNKNVGVVMNIVPTAKGTEDGVPMPYIIRGILERNTADDAIKFVKGLGGSAAPMNFIIGDATKVVTVENTAAGAKLFENFHGENWVAHTNHHLDIDVSTLPEGAVSKSVPRFQLLEQELKGKSKSVDAERVKQIFRTKPVLKNWVTDPGFPTMESIVIELTPRNPRVHIAPGPPDSNKYSTFDFKKGYVGSEED